MTISMTRAPGALGFVGATIDRADHIRSDPAALADAFADPAARVMRLDGLMPGVEGSRLVRGPVERAYGPDGHILLGLEDGAPLFARLPSTDFDARAFNGALWDALGLIDPAEMALYGAARALVDWHARHRFCAACGAQTHSVKGGWSRACSACGADHFPRVDPVTIMLAEHDGRVLVGRQPRFPARMYSALAGFVEPGETIEEAVARELFEEAGVRVHAVRYVMSQPWPFPSSLMIACIAQATDDALTIDTNELEHAMWVDADALRAVMEGRAAAPFSMPPARAVAHHLFAHWLDERG